MGRRKGTLVDVRADLRLSGGGVITGAHSLLRDSEAGARGRDLGPRCYTWHLKVGRVDPKHSHRGKKSTFPFFIGFWDLCEMAGVKW